ncbi:MAG TPA: MBL fold metallo-hydrolase, partial [Acidilobales archaeon]|nr:MBL fold metallo-hydrolase [Acidilobales archaeon]
VICTPGHTRGSVSFFFENFKWLFTGDTLFKGTIGRTDFLESSPMDMVKSLLKLMELPNDVIVYPGHGDRTTLGMEKINNPYLLDLMRKV